MLVYQTSSCADFDLHTIKAKDSQRFDLLRKNGRKSNKAILGTQEDHRHACAALFYCIRTMFKLS